MDWWDSQGVSKEKLEIYDVPSDELSHYSKKTYDLMYKFPHGVEELEGNPKGKVRAGEFWCEYFEGPHISGDYRYVTGQIPYWEPLSCWEGINYPINLSKFVEWKRHKHAPRVPKLFNELSDVAVINVEFIGDKPIDFLETPNCIFFDFFEF